MYRKESNLLPQITSMAGPPARRLADELKATTGEDAATPLSEWDWMQSLQVRVSPTEDHRSDSAFDGFSANKLNTMTSLYVPTGSCFAHLTLRVRLIVNRPSAGEEKSPPPPVLPKWVAARWGGIIFSRRVVAWSPKNFQLRQRKYIFNSIPISDIFFQPFYFLSPNIDTAREEQLVRYVDFYKDSCVFLPKKRAKKRSQVVSPQNCQNDLAYIFNTFLHGFFSSFLPGFANHFVPIFSNHIFRPIFF